MANIYWVRLKGVSIYEQLQLEEALLRTDARNWCLYNDEVPDAIVLGISNKEKEHLSSDFTRKNRPPLIRRFSGGGSVYVDPHTVFATFICNAQETGVEPFPQRVMHWTEKLYAPVFNGVPFAAKDNDYVIGDRKIGGNAQYMTKNRWLHHSTFLWNFDAAKMAHLTMPPRMPAYRQRRSHSEFLGRVCDFLPEKNVLEFGLKGQLAQHFNLVESSWGEASSALQLPHRKSTQVLQPEYL